MGSFLKPLAYEIIAATETVVSNFCVGAILLITVPIVAVLALEVLTCIVRTLVADVQSRMALLSNRANLLRRVTANAQTKSVLELDFKFKSPNVFKEHLRKLREAKMPRFRVGKHSFLASWVDDE